MRQSSMTIRCEQRNVYCRRQHTSMRRFLRHCKGLDEGEVSDVIDTDTDYYVVRLDEKTDADATEDDQTEHYQPAPERSVRRDAQRLGR